MNVRSIFKKWISSTLLLAIVVVILWVPFTVGSNDNVWSFKIGLFSENYRYSKIWAEFLIFLHFVLVMIRWNLYQSIGPRSLCTLFCLWCKIFLIVLTKHRLIHDNANVFFTNISTFWNLYFVLILTCVQIMRPDSTF